MTRSATALLTLLALLAALLSIMAWAARRTHNAADFAIANRRLGPWLVTLSYAATGVNAWMLMTVAAAAFLWGLSAAWIWAAVVLGCIVNMWFVAPRLRAASIGSGGITVIHLLGVDAGDRLQPLVVRSAVFIMMLTLALQIAAILQFAGVMLADVGLSTTNVLILSLAVMTATVFAGGMRAASMIDTMQSVVVIAVALFLPLPALIAAGGLTELKMAFTTIGPEAMNWFDGKSGVAAIAFAAGVVGLGLAMCGQPHALSRFMTAKDESTLRIARWVAPLWIAVLLAAVVFCGWCARVLYSGLEHPEQSLAVIASRLLPPWLATLIVVGLAAAVISAIASQLLVMASALGVDLRRPTSPPSLQWLRGMLLVAAVLICIVLLYAPSSLVGHAMFAFTALGASLGPLVLVRLSGKRIRPGSTLGEMWAGFLLSLIFHLLPDSPGDFLERVLPFIAALGIALTGGERRRNPDRADRSQETMHDRVPI
jgi:sodium/proline symporter